MIIGDFKWCPIKVLKSFRPVLQHPARATHGRGGEYPHSRETTLSSRKSTKKACCQPHDYRTI